MPLPRRRSRVRVAERRGRGRVVLAAAASMGNLVVPLDAASSGITLPLVEILRYLNKRVPETIVLPASRCASASDPVIPWYRANRMLSFYAPGWCGEVRDVIYNDNGKVTVVYRVTIRGIDGEEPEYIERLDVLFSELPTVEWEADKPMNIEAGSSKMCTAAYGAPRRKYIVLEVTKVI